MKVKSESEVAQSRPTVRNPMDAAYQAPPSMGFSRQEYWSGVPLPSTHIVLRIMVGFRSGILIGKHKIKISLHTVEPKADLQV